MKSFFIQISLLSLLIALVDYCWNNFVQVNYVVPNLWFIFCFFVFATFLFHVFTINASKAQPQKFIRYYMASSAIKMILYVIVILVYRFIDKPNMISFALAFMAHYAVYNIFEVIFLLKYLNKG